MFSSFPMTRTSPRSCPSHRSKSVCCVLNPLRSWPCTARFVAKCSKKWLQNPGISQPRSLKPHSAKLLFDSPHIQTLFRQKPAVFRTKSSTGKQTVQRTAAALYANARLETHQSLAAADGSGHHLNHKKLRGGSRILSDNARDHLNGFRLSVPLR